jgi:hypothetical protein
LADLKSPGIIFKMGVLPNRIGVITGIDGVTFDEAWKNRVSSTYGDQSVRIIGLDELVRNKKATGRPQDALDADNLSQKFPTVALGGV